MTHSESVFNDKLLHPCLKAAVKFLKVTSECGSYYVPGEESLKAMRQQILNMNSKISKRESYNADGVVRFASFEDLEVLILETSGPFKNKFFCSSQR